jgi:hypothetical protein
MYALKSMAGGKPSYALFSHNHRTPAWVSVVICSKFKTEGELLMALLRGPAVTNFYVKGPLRIAELYSTSGKQRYRLPDGVKSLSHVVHSSTGTGTYIVRVNAEGEGSCTCKDWQYRHAENGTPCKHMKAVLGHLPTQRGDVYSDMEEAEDF